MKSLALASIIIASLTIASSANAAEVGTTISVGTTGFGLHVTTPVASKVNARVGVNFANYSYDGSTSDVDYDFKLKLASVDALLDYHPFDGAFRISGGAVYNGNKVDATGKPNASGTYIIDGRAYSSSQVGDLNGKIDFRKVAPYLGIGFGNAVKSVGWGFGMDIGLTFQGSPKSELSANCTGSVAMCGQLGSALAAENAKLVKEMDDFKVYPVIRIGVNYRF
jgi:hypothetical protein